MSDTVMCARCGEMAPMEMVAENRWQSECPVCGFRTEVMAFMSDYPQVAEMWTEAETGEPTEMAVNEYQVRARLFAVYPDQGTTDGIEYVALGLTGESGEVANQVKKIVRDDNRKLTAERRAALIDEAGDVLWYLAMLAEELGVTLEEIAARNLVKLERRYGK